MITPRKVFLSFMLMLALIPVPILNASLAFSMTWVVLGIRKAMVVFAVAASYGIFMGAIFGENLFSSLTQRVASVVAIEQSCQPACSVTVATTLNAEILGILKGEELALAFSSGLLIFTFGQVYIRVRQIRRHTSSIRKFYWGPDR